MAVAKYSKIFATMSSDEFKKGQKICNRQIRNRIATSSALMQ